MRKILSLTIVLCLAFPGLSEGQTSEPRDPGIPMNYTPMKWFGTNLPKQTRYFMRLPGISPDYRLGQGDVIKVDVVGNEMLSQTFKIGNSGNINFLLLGDIRAGGLTAEELETEIASRLKAGQLVKAPEVLVYIESYEAKPIYVVGEVDTPGEFVMSQQLTLMDAIFLAGGLDYTASRYGYLHRRIQEETDSDISKGHKNIGKMPTFNVLTESKDEMQTLLSNPGMVTPGTEVIKFDLEPLKNGGVIEPNVLLNAGDVFVVPRRNVQFFYVVGDVVNPGAHEVEPGTTILTSQAISFAGGPAKTARMSKGILVRYDANGERRESNVDYAAILEGRQKDFEVFPDDIIFIPGSNAKTLGYALLGIIPNTIQRTVTVR